MKLNRKKIILGTAQLGSNYGITNSAKFIKNRSYKILDYAWKNGIKSFDTAPYYKNSEKTIGNFVESNSLQSKIKIFTKLPKIERLSHRSYYDFYCKSIDKSFKKLRTFNIHCIFNSNISNKVFLDNEMIYRLKKNFSINFFGASIYNLSDLKKIKNNKYSLFQVPLSLANQDFLNFSYAKKVVARSIFLQGILINKCRKKRLKKSLLKSLSKYFYFLEKKNIDPIEIAISFINEKKYINNYIFGVDNHFHLKKILHTEIKKYDKKVYKKILSFFTKKDVDPRNW